MTKVELEARVGALTDEINFLRCIYDEVGALSSPGGAEIFIRYMVAKNTEVRQGVWVDLGLRWCL